MKNLAPSFFVPIGKPESQEDTFATLAAFAGRAAPSLGQRIYSISFRQDGADYVATVGESLHGVRKATTRSRGKAIERTVSVSDPATILAIFPGDPYKVVTDSLPFGNARSAWENPFCSRPTSAVLFSKTG